MAAVDLNGIKSKQAQQEPVEVETAFLVSIFPGGRVMVSPDIDQAVMPKRVATADEIQMASRQLADSLQAEKTAALIRFQLDQLSQAARQAAADQQLVQSLKI